MTAIHLLPGTSTTLALHQRKFQNPLVQGKCAPEELIIWFDTGIEFRFVLIGNVVGDKSGETYSLAAVSESVWRISEGISNAFCVYNWGEK